MTLLPDGDRFIDTAAAGRLLGIAERTVRERAHEFGGFKLGPKLWKFSLATLKAYIKKCRDDVNKK